MGARAIFEDYVEADGPTRWELVERWVRERAEESLHLEFKTAQGQDGSPQGHDIRNLAKALSAFANTEGGILVFGVKTKSNGKIDCADRVAAVPNVATFAEGVQRWRRDRTDPPVPGVQQLTVLAPAADSSGVLLIFVPESHAGPHRVIGVSDQRDINDRYFARTGATSEVMSHRHLAAMFSSRPPPVLRLLVSQPKPYTIRFSIRNVGRGMAKSVQARWALLLPNGTAAKADLTEIGMAGWEFRNGYPDASKYPIKLQTTSLLYPDDVVHVGTMQADPSQKTGGFEQLKGSFSARLDAAFTNPRRTRSQNSGSRRAPSQARRRGGAGCDRSRVCGLAAHRIPIPALFLLHRAASRPRAAWFRAWQPSSR